MIVTGFIGTLVGRRVLHRMGDDRFRLALTILLTIFGVRLLWMAASRFLNL